MGGCVSSEDPQRYHRYDPGAESSADEQSDCASSDDESIALLSPGQLSERRRGARGTVQAAAVAAWERLTPGVPSGHVHIVPQVLPNASDVAAASSRFWQLGQHKWRESIDVKHQSHGRFVYDLCLHGGNGFRREVGYLSSMYDAWCFADDEFGFKSSERSWLALHFLCMQHPGNDFLNGRFRHLKQGNRAMISKMEGWTLTDEAHAEFKRMPKRLCYVEKLTRGTDSEKKEYSHTRFMPGNRRKTMRRYVRQYIADFYKSVGVFPVTAETVEDAVRNGSARAHLLRMHAAAPSLATADAKALEASHDIEFYRTQRQPFVRGRDAPWDKPVVREELDGDDARRAVLVVPVAWKEYPPPRAKVLSAAATLQQRLARIEPSRDGNTRTTVVLINKLLCECGLTPGLFTYPDGAAFMHHARWLTEVESAIAAGESAARGGDNFSEASLPDRWKHDGTQILNAGYSEADNAKHAARIRAAQFTRRPWFSDELLRVRESEGEVTDCARPPRTDFECPAGTEYRQRNAYFTE